MINIIYRNLYIQTLKNVCLCAHVRTRAYVRTLDNPKSTRFLLPTRSTILQPLSSFSILTFIHPFSLSPFTPIHPSIHPPIHPSTHPPIHPSTPLTIPFSSYRSFSLFLSLCLSLHSISHALAHISMTHYRSRVV